MHYLMTYPEGEAILDYMPRWPAPGRVSWRW